MESKLYVGWSVNIVLWFVKSIFTEWSIENFGILENYPFPYRLLSFSFLGRELKELCCSEIGVFPSVILRYFLRVHSAQTPSQLTFAMKKKEETGLRVASMDSWTGVKVFGQIPPLDRRQWPWD